MGQCWVSFVCRGLLQDFSPLTTVSTRSVLSLVPLEKDKNLSFV